jgi:hypothetical protein
MKYEIKQTDDVTEALCLLAGGAFYFLKHHTMKTILAIMLICGANIYVVFDYLRSDKITVEKLKPLTSSISIFPELYAGGENPIILDGKYYGENDVNYLIYKIKGSNEIIIYNKYLKTGFKYNIPALEDFKQLKRSR